MLIVLVGMCYSGKTTIGKLLSNRLFVESVDFADLFKKRIGKTELEYLNDHGKKYFKEAEQKVMSSSYDNMILSLSGSAIYQEDEMKELAKKATIIFLDAPLEVILDRQQKEGKVRPILYPDGIDTFEELYNQRRPLYSKHANIIVPIHKDDTPNNILERIAGYLS